MGDELDPCTRLNTRTRFNHVATRLYNVICFPFMIKKVVLIEDLDIIPAFELKNILPYLTNLMSEINITGIRVGKSNRVWLPG